MRGGLCFRTRPGKTEHAADRKVIARVNGQPIYESQIKPELEKRMAAYKRYGMRKDDSAMVKRLQASILNKSIGNLLVNQESRKRTVENIDEKVDQK